MLLLRFSSNVTPRTFFVTATSRTADVTMSATCLPLCSFDRVELRYGTKNDGEEQHGGNAPWRERSRSKSTVSPRASKITGRRRLWTCRQRGGTSSIAG